MQEYQPLEAKRDLGKLREEEKIAIERKIKKRKEEKERKSSQINRLKSANLTANSKKDSIANLKEILIKFESELKELKAINNDVYIENLKNDIRLLKNQQSENVSRMTQQQLNRVIQAYQTQIESKKYELEKLENERSQFTETDKGDFNKMSVAYNFGKKYDDIKTSEDVEIILKNINDRNDIEDDLKAYIVNKLNKLKTLLTPRSEEEAAKYAEQIANLKNNILELQKKIEEIKKTKVIDVEKEQSEIRRLNSELTTILNAERIKNEKIANLEQQRERTIDAINRIVEDINKIPKREQEIIDLNKEVEQLTDEITKLEGELRRLPSVSGSHEPTITGGNDTILGVAAGTFMMLGVVGLVVVLIILYIVYQFTYTVPKFEKNDIKFEKNDIIYKPGLYKHGHQLDSVGEYWM